MPGVFNATHPASRACGDMGFFPPGKKAGSCAWGLCSPETLRPTQTPDLVSGEGTVMMTVPFDEFRTKQVSDSPLGGHRGNRRCGSIRVW